ncbi:MAG: hypothetical protein IK038_11820 [Bacteroidaceae bacterium]|nr:hypothetical protein [Bacteroidaceae bacterium]
MKTKMITYMLLTIALLASCNKEELSLPEKENNIIENSETLCFSSAEDLANYARLLSNQESTIPTRSSDFPTFTSLWDYQREEVLSKLTQSEIIEAENEGLYYEPEDEIIPDPIFAKILNPKREVTVSGETYRYVTTGVIVYNENADKEYVNNIDVDSFSSLQDKEEVALSDGIKFIRLHYQSSLRPDYLETKAPTIDPGLYTNKLVLKDGTSIPKSEIQMVEYAQGSGDANGFQKTISSIFGTSVVAENYFDSNHRMKLRTFSQDFVVYTSVGMTVRMQQKQTGIWWRKKAQEFRYGWTAVECYYTYNGPSFPTGVTFQNASMLMHDHTNYYEKPIVLFSIPVIDYQVTDKTVSALLKSLLQKNQARINSWLNNNPSYSSNPYSVFSADKANGYSMIFPQYEDVETDDGREQVNWDFRVHFQAGVKIGGGGVSPTFSPVGDPEKIEIRRGDIYAAVKYNDQWKACVISAR